MKEQKSQNSHPTNTYTYRLTEERAAFYLHAAEIHFPEQYKIIKQDIDEVERQFPLMQ